MSVSPALVVAVSSPAGLAMVEQLLGNACAELPSSSLMGWQTLYGHAPESAESLEALTEQEWPGVFVIDAATTSELLAPLARVWPDVRFLLLVDEPATSLAASLPLPPDLTIVEWCARHATTVQRMRRHMQRHPSRSLCLLSREVAQSPQAVESLLQARLGLELPVASHPLTSKPPTELNLALAEMLLAPERHFASSAAELLACCQPIGPVPIDGGPAPPERDLIVKELATLTERAASAARLNTRVTELELGIERQARMLGASESARAEATSLLTKVSAELESAKRASKSLLTDLRAVKDQLAHEARERQTLATTLDAQVAALDASQAACESLAEAKASTEKRLHELQAQTEQCGQEVVRLVAETERLKAGLLAAPASAALDICSRDKDLLLVHLHQVQEELESLTLGNHSLALRSGISAGGPPLFLGECRVERVRDLMPHLELELCLREVRLGDALAFEQLRLRLVEHHMQPGIVFARDPSLERQYLSTWLENGREGEVPHMLIVPSDLAGRTCLQALPTSDWDALLTLVHRLHRELAEDPETKATGWPSVAARLARQLADMSPRLRYDRLDVIGAPGELTIRFDNLIYGLRRFDQLELLWQPEATLPLSVVAPSSKASPPALDVWPSNHEGERQTLMPVPAGKMGLLNKRRSWMRLTPTDRGLLLALLDSLPAATQAGRRSSVLSDAQAERLRGEARRLLRDALAASGEGEPPLRRLARRLRVHFSGHGFSAAQHRAVSS